MTSESAIPPEAKEPLQAANEANALLAGAQEPDDHSSARTAQVSLAALAAKLPLQLDLRVPLPSFRVQNLLSLEKGQVIESSWPHTEDLPLWSGGVHLVWTEFEVVDQKLAVRITRLV
jgi:hypothetical protein